MIITCKQCATDYFLDDDRIKPSGSRVKCSRCQHLFVAFPPSAEDVQSPPPSPRASGTELTDEATPDVPDAASSAKPGGSKISNLAAGIGGTLGAAAGAASLFAQSDETTDGKHLDSPATGGAEDPTMHDLTDELDKILGSDEMDDLLSATDETDQAKGMAEPGLKEEDDLLSDLDEDLDLLSGDLAESATDTNEPDPAGYDPDIDVLDLSTLGDELDGAGDEPPVPDGGIDLDSIQLEDIDSEIQAMPSGPAAASLTDSEDIEMADLTAGLDELLGPDTHKPQAAPLSEEAQNTDSMDTTTEDQEISDLSDKLDNILGNDEMSDLSVDKSDAPESESMDLDGEPGMALDSLIDEVESEELDLSDLDGELDEMFKSELSASKPEHPDIDVELDGDIDLDTIQIQDLDLELENIEEIPPQPSEAATGENISEVQQLSDLGIQLEELEIPEAAPEASEAEGSTEEDILSTEQIDDIDFDFEPEQPDSKDEVLDDNFVLDTKQIKNLDLELDQLDPEIPDPSTEEISLDTQQIEGLDLDFDDLEDESLDEAFGLDTKQVDMLDLDLDPGPKATAPAEPAEPPLNAKDQSPNTDEPLDIEIEDIEEVAPAPKEAFDKDVSITLDTDKGKQAEVLNVNLERPDLEDGYSEDDEIDLPILDQLLAPAEVTDESLMEADNNTLAVENMGLSDQGMADPGMDDLSLEDLEIDSQSPKAGDLPSKENLSDVNKSQPAIESGSLDFEDIDMAMEKTLTDEAETGAEKPAESAAAGPPPLDSTSPAEESKTTARLKLDPVKDSEAKTLGPVVEDAAFPKKKSRKSLIALLLIALLLGGLYLFNMMGIKIPYLSNMMGAGTQQVANDPGNAQLKTVGIDSKFVTSNNSGRLFVITGKVLNQYKQPRGSILIKGNIFAKGGKLIKARSVYCGNSLSDQDLGTKALADIQKNLSNKAGAGSLKVPPGKTAPFMIVFANLPSDIEEFSVEVIRSVAR